MFLLLGSSPQGKTLGYVTLLAADDSILVRSDPGGLACVLPHFRKYGIFDEVTIEEAGMRVSVRSVAEPTDAPISDAPLALPEPSTVRRRVVISGRVQGVGFRYSCQRRAVEARLGHAEPREAGVFEFVLAYRQVRLDPQHAARRFRLDARLAQR